MRKPTFNTPAAKSAASSTAIWIGSICEQGKIPVTYTPGVELILAQAAKHSGRGRADICREILSMVNFGSSKLPDTSCVYFRVFLGAAEHTFAVRAVWGKNGEPMLTLMRSDESATKNQGERQHQPSAMKSMP